jgi:hypothetical protein
MQVWNLADFRTSQGIVRPASLKMAAHFLRERWFGKSGRP